jgi:hypothetical protein
MSTYTEAVDAQIEDFHSPVFLIEATKSAVKVMINNLTRAEMNVRKERGWKPEAPPVFWAWGLGTEEIKIQLPKVVDPAVGTDADWMDSEFVLSASEPVKAFFAAGIIRLEKPATASDCGVMMSGWPYEITEVS